MPVTLLLPSILASFLACTGDKPGDDTADPGVVGSITGVDLALSELIPTVVTVRWAATEGSSSASVAFGPDGDLRWQAPAHLVDGAEGPEWQASLVGMKPGSQASIKAEEIVAEGALQSEVLNIETGVVTIDLPSLELTIEEEGHWSDGFLLGTIVTNPATAVLFDPDGEVVWWAPVEDPSEKLGRVRISRDGLGVYMMPINVLHDLDNFIMKVSWAGELLETIEVGGGHHDFVELEDGTLAWATHDDREVDGELVGGDELTLRALDGSTRALWSIWDWRPFDPDELMNTGGGNSDVNEWTHLNSIVYQDGDFLLGSLGLSAILKVDGTTGEQLWTFGSPTGDFADADGNVNLLDSQHQFQLLDDGLLVFENGSSLRASSRAVEFSFDEDVPLVEERWTYWPDPTIYAISLGNPQRLANGNTLVAFGTGGQIDEVTPEGAVIWRLNTGLGGAFGYMDLIDSVY